jgi:hypothetical protein
MRNRIDAFAASALGLEQAQRRLDSAIEELIRAAREPHDSRWLMEWRGKITDLVAILDGASDELLASLADLVEGATDERPVRSAMDAEAS